MVKQFPWLSALIILLSGANYLLAPFASDAFAVLALDQSRPFNAVSWLSAHLTHSDANHLFWNMAVMALLGVFIEPQQRLLLLVTIVATVLALDVWFYGQQQFQVYVGLSGVLNAVLVVALYCLRAPGAVWAGNQVLWLVLVLALAKNFYELVSVGALFSNTRWQTTPSFHLVGMAAGVVVVLLWHRYWAHRQAAYE